MITTAILQACLTAVSWLISALLSVLPVFEVPTSVTQYLTIGIDYFISFMKMADPIFPIPAQVGLVVLFSAFYSSRLILAVFSWSLAKIPFVGSK